MSEPQAAPQFDVDWLSGHAALLLKEIAGLRAVVQQQGVELAAFKEAEAKRTARKKKP